MLEDSGTRREFSTGAVRDIVEGKGRCDLMPISVVADVLKDDVLIHIGKFLDSGGTAEDELIEALHWMNQVFYTDLYYMMVEVSHQYEEGAQKYGEHNWEKGIPLHSFIDSGIRHYMQARIARHIRQFNEDHRRGAVWNLLGAIWTLRNHPELNDLSASAAPKKSDGLPTIDAPEGSKVVVNRVVAVNQVPWSITAADPEQMYDVASHIDPDDLSALSK